MYITFSFKRILTEINFLKETTVNFMKEHSVLKSSLICPRPCISGKRMNCCGKHMKIKVTNDNKDKFMWCCRKVHWSEKNNKKYVTKDVKLSIRHQSWLVDTKLTLETVLELIYLWSQSFSIKEIIHELKISNKTAVEWCTFFRECCISTIIDNSQAIGSNGIEVEIDESKFGKRKYYHGHKVEGQWVFGGCEKVTKPKYL